MTELAIEDLLEIISYDLLITALGLGLAAAFIFKTNPGSSEALGMASGVLLILSTASHRLANH